MTAGYWLIMFCLLFLSAKHRCFVQVLMVGKNRITQISNLQALRKLDVLDLHSNEIEDVQGLDSLV